MAMGIHSSTKGPIQIQILTHMDGISADILRKTGQGFRTNVGAETIRTEGGGCSWNINLYPHFTSTSVYESREYEDLQTTCDTGPKLSTTVQNNSNTKLHLKSQNLLIRLRTWYKSPKQDLKAQKLFQESIT
ncbi:hypothetical protein KQX54_017309 [Cotesia glomerata]|uniref:Uncharacterized protein n=1 Tax=Cotesia glomerata TaxID=32391 RepID=A0AAV7IZW3_COTGL|nr:hypothetical protein KQX54_017309 [Cotesia glomerata]